MALVHFHRALIVASILFDVWFSYWCWGAYRLSDDGTYLALLIGSTVAMVGFVAYLVYFNRKTRRLHENI